MFEFCWVSCHVMLIYLTSGYVDGVLNLNKNPLTFSKNVFYGFWGLANGPFALAIVWSNHALVLHSMKSMTAAFIHISPCTLAWALRWYSPKVMNAWPGVFDLPDPSSNNESFLQIFVPSIVFYSVWVIGYFIFVLFLGRKHGLPDS